MKVIAAGCGIVCVPEDWIDEDLEELPEVLSRNSIRNAHTNLDQDSGSLPAVKVLVLGVCGTNNKGYFVLRTNKLALF